MEISETGGTMKTFEVKEDFYLDGKKVKIISGGMSLFSYCAGILARPTGKIKSSGLQYGGNVYSMESSRKRERKV